MARYLSTMAFILSTISNHILFKNADMIYGAWYEYIVVIAHALLMMLSFAASLIFWTIHILGNGEE